MVQVQSIVDSFRRRKPLGGVLLWIILSASFSASYCVLPDSAAIALLVSLLLHAWTSAKWSPVLKWVYESKGADLIVQQLTVMYCLEIVTLVVHLSQEPFKRYFLSYFSHTITFLYALHHLPKWKLIFIHRYFFYTSITSSTAFLGVLTCATVPLQKVFNFLPILKLDNVNFLSLDDGFLIRFFTLFFLQAVAYYKRDLDNQNVIQSGGQLSRKFG